MSPEQALGGRVDARSDIYSLGVVVFEAFTGRVPFRGETPVATILLHVQQPPPLEGVGAAGLPREVVPLLRRALAKAQADRPASARELADGLRAAWGEHAAAGAVTPTSPPTVTLSQSAPRTVRAHRWPAVSTAVAMTALVGVGVLLLARSAALRPGLVAASPGAAPSVAGLPAASPAATPTETAPSPLEARPSSAPTARTQEAAARPAATPTPASLPVPAAAAAPVAQAYLVVVVVPWADVMLDGTPVKAVPLRRLPLSPGEHVVRFVHPDYQPLQRVVTARPGETVTLTVDLPEEGVRTGK
jgi:serine/threonine-protein kinase